MVFTAHRLAPREGIVKQLGVSGVACFADTSGDGVGTVLGIGFGVSGGCVGYRTTQDTFRIWWG